jgi:hypothetical protein
MENILKYGSKLYISISLYSLLDVECSYAMEALATSAQFTPELVVRMGVAHLMMAQMIFPILHHHHILTLHRLLNNKLISQQQQITTSSKCFTSNQHLNPFPTYPKS